jgi:hypothetical protein
MLPKRDQNQLQTDKKKFLKSVADYFLLSKKRSEGDKEELEISNLNYKIQ